MNNAEGKRTKMFMVQYLDCAMGNTHLEKFSLIHTGTCHVVSIGEFIYFNIVNTNILTRFNKSSLLWESLKVSSYNVDASDTTNSMSCACQQFMSVIGGSCYRRLNTATNLWQTLPFPTCEHYRPGVCCLDNKVYVIGGCDKFYQESVNHVERLDTANKSWETLSPLPTARWGIGTAVMHSMIYVVGGYETESNCPLNTVEVYNPENNTWASVAPLVYPRRRFGIAVVNGVIYVAGGYGKDTLEWYDESNDQWKVIEGASVNRHDLTCLALPVPQCW